MTAIHSHLHRYPSPSSRASAIVVAGAALAAAISLTTGPGLSTEASVQRAPMVNRLSLTQRVLPSNAVPELVATTRPTVIRSTYAWALDAERSVAPAREAARLRQLGFVGGVDERLRRLYPDTAHASSVAEQFGSPAAARAELAQQYKQLTRSTAGEATSFRVTGIPGAVGVKVTNRHEVALNVMFAAGSYYYLIGAQSPAATQGALTRAQLIGAGQEMYLLTSGCMAPGTTPHIAS